MGSFWDINTNNTPSYVFLKMGLLKDYDSEKKRSSDQFGVWKGGALVFANCEKTETASLEKVENRRNSEKNEEGCEEWT